MVTKRVLKSFECPPNITEKMDGVEILKRVEETLDSTVSKRVNVDLLKLTHNQLWQETQEALEKLKTVDTQENRIIWEDSKAKIIDCMEKLTTPCPFNKQEMFGRDQEISAIKEELLNKQSNTSIIMIGGETGIGKTMVAQYLFEDSQVCEAFDIRDWINCDDFEEDIFNNYYSDRLFDVLTESWRDKVDVLIVIDGWRPSFPVLNFLRIARLFPQVCLKILVTTTILSCQNQRPRSKSKIATFHSLAMLKWKLKDLGLHEDTTYYLFEGLQEESSRALFESLAFSSEGSNEQKTRILEAKIGSKILNSCGNNPCVIKTIASILSTKTTLEEWKHFEEVVWPSLQSPAETISSNLNLVSFKRLPFFMKRCLLYCSLFPIDYEFNIADLKLWWAIEFNSNAKISSVGDEYLRKLQNMGYFIEHTKTDDNDTLSYKMPILSCEFIKTVAKEYNEYQSFDGSGDNEHVDPETIRHISFMVNGSSWHAPPWLGVAKHLRSFLFLGESCETISGFESIITSTRFLQILNITMVNCEKLARYFENLELLRSLRLGITDPDFFTEFLTRTQNLRVLDLQRSNALIVLTEGFQKLLSLGYLYVGSNNMFYEKLPICGELVSLSKSNVLMMGRNNALNTLADYNYIAENQTIDYSKSEKISKDIYNFCDRSLIWVSSSHGYDDVVLKTLQAPPTLKSLTIRGWNRLITAPQFLGLSSVKIMDCHKCESLPSFGTLPKLKSFTLWNLSALKYLEDIDIPENNPYFSSLESLILANLPKLEAWNDNRRTRYGPAKNIPRLTKLKITGTKIDFLPVTGDIVSLETNDISVKLFKDLVSSIGATLKTLNISAIRGLDSISIDLPKLESMTIRQCHELATFIVESDSIKSLEFHECGKLKELSMPSHKMSQLMKLEIECCPELDLPNMIPWKSLTNLRHLLLMNLTKLESLPDGLIWLAELKKLSICWVYDLKALPEWICSLRHLHRLIVRNCPSLTTVPESLGELLNNSGDLRVEFRNCRALKRLPKSFPRNQSSQLVIKECPKLEISMLERVDYV